MQACSPHRKQGFQADCGNCRRGNMTGDEVAAIAAYGAASQKVGEYAALAKERNRQGNKAGAKEAWRWYFKAQGAAQGKMDALIAVLLKERWE